MKTLIYFLALASAFGAEPYQTVDGVVSQKIDGSYIFVFPSHQVGNSNPAGRIDLGTTITVMYSLKVMGSSKSRFILMDESKAKAETPKLKVEKADEQFGFLVKDNNQPLLKVYIDPSFNPKQPASVETIKGKVARQGNLTVTMETKNGQPRIISAKVN